MDESTQWWLMAGVLVVAELATGTFYLLMIALGAVAGPALGGLTGTLTGSLAGSVLGAGAAAISGALLSSASGAIGHVESNSSGERSASNDSLIPHWVRRIPWRHSIALCYRPWRRRRGASARCWRNGVATPRVCGNA